VTNVAHFPRLLAVGSSVILRVGGNPDVMVCGGNGAELSLGYIFLYSMNLCLFYLVGGLNDTTSRQNVDSNG
jgi:hypothetical protein